MSAPAIPNATPPPVQPPLPWLTVLSNLEDATLAEIRNVIYPLAHKTFLHLSAWNDVTALRGVVVSTVLVPLDADGPTLRRLDLVGHALVDLSTDSDEGFVMGSGGQVGFGIVRGDFVGGDCFKALLSFCKPDVQIRLLFCSSDRVSPKTLQSIYAMARAVCPQATLWSTTKALGSNNFGPGGFSDEQSASLLELFQPPT